MRIVSVAQMVELEQEADQRGLTYEKMMANAGNGLADIVHQSYFEHSGKTVLGLIGSGNNGGDTLVALTKLLNYGWSASAYLVKERDFDDLLIKNFRNAGGEIAEVARDGSFSQLKNWLVNAEVILDGILGTGTQLPLRGDILKVLDLVKSTHTNAVVVAVDCPSGIDCDTGETADECLPADQTICLAAVKAGLLKKPAYKYTGEISVVDIGLPKTLNGWKLVGGEVLTRSSVTGLVPNREIDSHKGSFGTCMIAAGSVNYCGAVLLASKGAYRVGTGLVRAAIPGAIYDTLAGQLPEATWIVLPHTDGVFNRDSVPLLRRNLDRVTALLIGPGIGMQDDTRHFIESLLMAAAGSSRNRRPIGFTDTSNIQIHDQNNSFPPIVIDADALKLLHEIENWWYQLPKNSVLTPHPGEMAALTRLSIDEIQKARVETACEFAGKWGQVIVLKGAMTVIADPKGKYAIIPIATSALATAGTGDVLAGMIVGFLAQGLSAFSAAKAGAWIHARAGQIAAEKLGSEASVMAGDVADAITDALKLTTGIRH